MTTLTLTELATTIAGLQARKDEADEVVKARVRDVLAAQRELSEAIIRRDSYDTVIEDLLRRINRL
jgi:hypothetical protein